MMKMAQEMQAKMQKMQEELAKKEVEGSAGGDMVIVRANGKHEIVSIKLSPEVVDPEDIEMLQDLIHAAVNDAMRKVEEMLKTEMASITGGMNIPGLSGLM